MRYSFNFMQFLEFVSIAFFGDGINPLSKSDKKWSHETNNQGVGEFLARSFLLGAAGWGLDKANVRLLAACGCIHHLGESRVFLCKVQQLGLHMFRNSSCRFREPVFP